MVVVVVVVDDPDWPLTITIVSAAIARAAEISLDVFIVCSWLGVEREIAPAPRLDSRSEAPMAGF